MAFNNKASYRLSVAVVEFRYMADELSVLPPRRAVAWAAIGVLLVAALVLYFVYSPAVPPLTAEPAVDTTAAP
jgi:hypothetical protein